MENKNIELTQEEQLEFFTQEILKLKKQTAENLINIGRYLYYVKDSLEHGGFTKYLEEKVNFTRQTANKFMKVFIEFEDNENSKSPLHLNWGIEKLYMLTTISKDEREEFVSTNNIEEMSTRELKKKIKEVKNTKKVEQKVEKEDDEKIIEVEPVEDIKTKEEIVYKTKIEELKLSVNYYEELKKKIKDSEQNIKKIKEDILKNTPVSDDMSVKFAETESIGTLCNLLGYNIYFVKCGVEQLIYEDYGARWFKNIDVNNSSDILVYILEHCDTLLQSEKDFILGECLKFAETASKRADEWEDEYAKKQDNKIYEEIFGEGFTEEKFFKMLNERKKRPLANKETLKKFYKTLAKTYHPDSFGGDGTEMKIVNQLKEMWGV